MNNNDLSGQCGNNKNSPGSCRGYASLFQRILRKSSIYAIAGKSKEAITKGREQIANVLGAKPEEIYFTAGGSESDNWALKATFEAYKNKGNHIITTKIEHHAILHTCEYLEKERGAKITYIGVDENGVVNLDELEAAITLKDISKMPVRVKCATLGWHTLEMALTRIEKQLSEQK